MTQKIETVSDCLRFCVQDYCLKPGVPHLPLRGKREELSEASAGQNKGDVGRVLWVVCDAPRPPGSV